MERSPDGWHSRRRPATGGRNRHRRPRRLAWLAATAVSIAAAMSLAIPAPVAGAANASPKPTLKELLAEASKLSRQIDSLSQQYDALRIQFNEAKAQVKVARLTVHRDEQLLATKELPESLRTLIVNMADGNPFFVEEVLAATQEDVAVE